MNFQMFKLVLEKQLTGGGLVRGAQEKREEQEEGSIFLKSRPTVRPRNSHPAPP